METVDEYIAKASRPAQDMMKQIRAAIKIASPKAREKISYRMPFYEYKFPGYRGRPVYFGAFKDHVSMFIVPRSVPAAIAKQLKR